MISKKLTFILLLSVVVLFTQCSDDSGVSVPPGGGSGANSGPSSAWLIPQSSVFDGGPGKDGIPAINNPNFITVDQEDFLNDNDLVLGLKAGDDIRAYPHPILDWHEIINDEVQGKSLSVTYCPLTGTGIGWNSDINGNPTTFGVSGLLYNTNLIPYDRRTDTNWSQMLLKAVNGELSGTKINTTQLIEMPWGVWRTMYPNTLVVSTNTGYSRNYNRYPYGDYRTNHSNLIFPVGVEDNRLPWKKRVLGVVIKEQAKAFKFESLRTEGDGDVGTINDSFLGEEVVVVGSREKNFMVAYNRKLEDGTVLSFSPVDDALPVVMKDDEGNEWDLFGVAVSGPRVGTQLGQMDSFIGYWVAWGAFYPDLDLR